MRAEAEAPSATWIYPLDPTPLACNAMDHAISTSHFCLGDVSLTIWPLLDIASRLGLLHNVSRGGTKVLTLGGRVGGDNLGWSKDARSEPVPHTLC